MSKKHVALIYEFEQYLRERFGSFEKEAVFSKFMNNNRQFRADYLILNEQIIIEINGGQYIRGRHNRGGKGYENDLTKSNIAQKNDYRYYQFTYEMLERLEYIKILE